MTRQSVSLGSSTGEPGGFLVQFDCPGENGLQGTPAGGPPAPEPHAASALRGRWESHRVAACVGMGWTQVRGSSMSDPRMTDS